MRIDNVITNAAFLDVEGYVRANTPMKYLALSDATSALSIQNDPLSSWASRGIRKS